MPLLYSLGQHAALEAVKEGLQDEERLFAFLDDVYAVTTPERVGHVYAAVHIELQRHCSVRINVTCGTQRADDHLHATCC